MPHTAKRDYYEVLGVERSADGSAIKRAYRRLAMKYHPDRNGGEGAAEAEIRFKECAEAYEILSDPEKRARYDRFGHSGVTGQHDFSHMDASDIFSMFDDIFGGMFNHRGGGSGRRPAGPARGYDLETQVQLTLAEVKTGAEKTIEFERQDTCDKCEGSGAKPGSQPVDCVQCGGTGRVAQQGFGGMFRMVSNCPNCRGNGRIIRDHCTQCGGTGRELRKSTVTVKIPAGVHEGQAVRITGEGEPGVNGGPRGDLHCYITIKPHPMFSRHNNDLVCQVPISFTQAALGGEVEVPTLDGTDTLDLPGGTQHGQVFKLKEKGLPDVRTQRTGDEVVQILVEIPRKLSDRQRELLREFAMTEDHQHMPQKKGFVEKLKEMFTGEA